MSEFRLINEKRFPLDVHSSEDNVDLLPYYRWEHRVTLGYRGKRFMVFLDNLESKAYIEDITNGKLEIIEDDNLWEAVFNYATTEKYLNILKPMMKPVGYKKSNIDILEKSIKV